MPEDHTPYTAAYLIFEDEGKVLLHKRKNTGFKDGKYSLVAGHVEEDETFKDTMVREAKEEVGIDIRKDDLDPVHVMHRVDGRAYVDVYFRITEWGGEVSNKEPEKCSELRWVEPDNLPEKTIGFVKEVIQKKDSPEFYGEKK